MRATRPYNDDMLFPSRVRRFPFACRFVAALVTAALALPFSTRGAESEAATSGEAAFRPPSLRNAPYADLLGRAISGMEAGRHSDGAAPLQAALTLDRNDAVGALTLATMYLHTNRPAEAEQGFARVRAAAPNEPLATWGLALSYLAQGKLAPAQNLFDAVSDRDIPAAPLLRAYTRLLMGDAKGARALLDALPPPDPKQPALGDLRQEIKAFALLRGGDAAAGASLLQTLTQQSDFSRLAEDRAVVLPFEAEVGAEGGASPLASGALSFPKTLASGQALTGRVTLAPPADLRADVAFVSYFVDGGAFSASVNYAPFTTEWNTARLPNGLYVLRVSAYDNNRNLIRETARTVAVANRNAPASSRLSPDEIARLRPRLVLLLTPHASRKAAHFALAERAVAVGDSAGALSHIESVVAIDPLFNNARASLRRYNREVAGDCVGLWKAATTQNLVALTFDDGPNPALTPALLDALKAASAPATFFVVGVRAEQSPGLLQRMDREGHEVANHSYSHPNLTMITPTMVERELCRTSCIVRDAIGKRPRFYRPPGGNFNTSVVDSARALGMAGAYWTVDGIKFEGDAQSPARLTQFVMAGLRPGAIVLLHNAPPTTTAAIPALVQALRAKGYTLVTMSELARRAQGQSVTAKPVVAKAGAGTTATKAAAR